MLSFFYSSDTGSFIQPNPFGGRSRTRSCSAFADGIRLLLQFLFNEKSCVTMERFGL